MQDPLSMSHVHNNNNIIIIIMHNDSSYHTHDVHNNYVHTHTHTHTRIHTLDHGLCFGCLCISACTGFGLKFVSEYSELIVGRRGLLLQLLVVCCCSCTLPGLTL